MRTSRLLTLAALAACAMPPSSSTVSIASAHTPDADPGPRVVDRSGRRPPRSPGARAARRRKLARRR